MCGIFMYWGREATIDSNIYGDMIRGAEKRGQDGFGIVHIKNRPSASPSMFKFYGIIPFSKLSRDISDQCLKNICIDANKGDIVLGVCRATPETEPSTMDSKNLQPIHYDTEGLILAHNGAVTKSDYERLTRKKLYTKIDSEAILIAYLDNGKNLKRTMENLSGSFAFILIDQQKNQMYMVCSFNPLYHAYVKGYGYFVHSDLETLEQMMKNLVGVDRDGCNVWEYWYHSEVPPYTIITTDFDSGMQHREKFRPKFIYPGWDIKPDHRNKVLISASGGIDSSLTAFVLQKCGYEVELVHFQYGQKSEDAETRTIMDFADQTKMHLKVIDLNAIYGMNAIAEKSMLTNPNIPVTTGQEYMKSSLAWVPGRNMMFLSILTTLAESYLMSKQYSRISIAAGWSQLTEETGGYPDNSTRFVNSFFKMIQFGTITGHDIGFLQIMGNITKTEQWVLGDAIGFPFELTCSCDCPKVVDGKIFLCSDCGSTKLSYWAAIRAGVKDPRKFYRRDMSTRGYKPKDLKYDPTKVATVEQIADRLLLSLADKNLLLKVIKKNRKVS